MLDHYVQGNANRISPEVPIQVLDVTDEFHTPGGAANVAMKVVGLGSTVRLVGLIGADRAAADFQALLRSHPAVTDGLIVDPGRSTTVKTRFIAHNQQLLRVDRDPPGDPDGRGRDQLVEAARAATADSDVVILEDYGKGVLGPEVMAAAMDEARRKGIPIVVDPMGGDYRRYAGSTILTPNLKEAAMAADRPITDLASLEEPRTSWSTRPARPLRSLAKPTGSLCSAARYQGARSNIRMSQPFPSLFTTSPAPATRWSRPSRWRWPPRSRWPMPAPWPILPGGRSSGNSASVRSRRPTCSRRPRADRPARWSSLPTWLRPVSCAQEVKRAGGKVVFTNGCFDILHYGHAHLLQYSRSQGDFLILGLNTDSSVRRFKGPSRLTSPKISVPICSRSILSSICLFSLMKTRRST